MTLNLPNTWRLVVFVCFYIAALQIPILLRNGEASDREGSGDSGDRETNRESDDGAVVGSTESYHEQSGDLSSNNFFANWNGSRIWFGPEYWANPLQDWKLENGRAIAPAAYRRTLCLLPFEVERDGSFFEMKVDVQLDIKAQKAEREKFGSGFRIGRRGRVDDFRSSLIDDNVSIDAYLRADGSLVLLNTTSEEKFNIDSGSVKLKLSAVGEEKSVKLLLSGTQSNRTISVEQSVDLSLVTGTFCLLSEGDGHPGNVESSFSNLSLEGDYIKVYEKRNFGPILWSQYSLNDGKLRVLAQLALLEESIPVKLRIYDDNSNLLLQKESSSDVLSRSVIFDIDDWDGNAQASYETVVELFDKEHTWPGIIRKEPNDDDTFRIAVFSCDHGYTFPLTSMVEQVKNQNPDLMYFAGDQIYEVFGGFGDARTADTNLAMIDFQRKYYQFGWTWRDLLRDRPSIILPDDHDVFQGNLFGNGGTQMKNDPPYAWGDGGYIMPSEWINAVESMQVGHLPNPAVDRMLPIGIKPYYTSMVYGGIGFAILEDRKFKTAPGTMAEEKQKTGEGGHLLGQEQENFLNTWANDWNNQEMKVALSQTIFSKATTHETPELKRIYYDHDSGGWPRDARNRAVKILGDNNVLSIHGDQHLGVLARLGVKNFNDAGYAFMVPGTANGWPRAWWPGLNKDEVPEKDRCFLGEYIDDSKHPLTMLAVANPEKGSFELDPNETDVHEIAYRKGSGYGLVELDKKSKNATINLYRTGRENEQFNTFPKTVYIGGRVDRNTKHASELEERDSTCSVRFLCNPPASPPIAIVSKNLLENKSYQTAKMFTTHIEDQ